MNDENKIFEFFSNTIINLVKTHDKKKNIELEKIEIDFQQNKHLNIHWKKESAINQMNFPFSLAFTTSSIFQLNQIIDNIFARECNPRRLSLEIKIIGNEIKYEIFENYPQKIKIDKEIKINEQKEFCNLIMFAFLYYIDIFDEKETSNKYLEERDKRINLIKIIEEINKMKKEEEITNYLMKKFKKEDNKISYILDFLKNKKKLIFILFLIIFTFFFFLVKKYFK